MVPIEVELVHEPAFPREISTSTIMCVFAYLDFAVFKITDRKLFHGFVFTIEHLNQVQDLVALALACVLHIHRHEEASGLRTAEAYLFIIGDSHAPTLALPECTTRSAWQPFGCALSFTEFSLEG